MEVFLLRHFVIPLCCFPNSGANLDYFTSGWLIEYSLLSIEGKALKADSTGIGPAWFHVLNISQA